MNKVLKASSPKRAIARPDCRLTASGFQGLADVPPELEWFANIDNPQTRRAYQNDLQDFTRFVGIQQPEEFRRVTRPHVIAWRKDLEGKQLAPATIRRKLSALTSMFDSLCEQNAVTHNPVDGVKRPKEGRNGLVRGEGTGGDGREEAGDVRVGLLLLLGRRRVGAAE